MGDSKKKSSQEDENILRYANEIIHNMGLGDPTTCVYQFTFDREDSDGTHIPQYFVMHVLLLCIKLSSYFAHFSMYGYSVTIRQYTFL